MPWTWIGVGCLIPFSSNPAIMALGNFISRNDFTGTGTCSPSTRILRDFLNPSWCKKVFAKIWRGAVQLQNNDIVKIFRYKCAVGFSYLVLMGSSYWIPKANSPTPMRAFLSATLSKIFSSSFSCFSIALSFLAATYHVVYIFTQYFNN